METSPRNSSPDFESLPSITYRQLAVFSIVCREKSYSNAAVERRTTRANIKRVMKDLEEAVGRPLFIEKPGKDLELPPFTQGLLAEVSPLARALRRLGDGVRMLHQDGRILRFAAPADFFKGGQFSGFLERMRHADGFRPCFLKIEVKRFRTALLNAECDVYFGIGLAEPERLECIDFGCAPWFALRHLDETGELPQSPADLKDGDWALGEAGEAGAAELLASFRQAGAQGGELVPEAVWREALANPGSRPRGKLWLIPDTEGGGGSGLPEGFPSYRFTAVTRRNHPYAELHSRLKAAAEGGSNGH